MQKCLVISNPDYESGLPTTDGPELTDKVIPTKRLPQKARRPKSKATDAVGKGKGKKRKSDEIAGSDDDAEHEDAGPVELPGHPGEWYDKAQKSDAAAKFVLPTMDMAHVDINERMSFDRPQYDTHRENTQAENVQPGENQDENFQVVNTQTESAQVDDALGDGVLS